MREQYVIQAIQDITAKVDSAYNLVYRLANEVLNLRTNYAILTKALEQGGHLSPEMFKAAVEELKKMGQVEPPSEDKPENKEEKNDNPGA